MNERKEKFAAALVESGRVGEAAITAGYPEASAAARGTELLHRSDVLNRVADLIRIRASDADEAETLRLLALARKFILR